MRLSMLQLLQRAAVGAALFYAQALAWAQLPAAAADAAIAAQHARRTAR